MKHYLSLPHPELLAPLDEVEKYLNSLKEKDICALVSTYPSLQSVVSHNKENKKVDLKCLAKLGDVMSFREMIHECLFRHWFIELILPFVLNWVLSLLSFVIGGSSATNVSLNVDMGI